MNLNGSEVCLILGFGISVGVTSSYIMRKLVDIQTVQSTNILCPLLINSAVLRALVCQMCYLISTQKLSTNNLLDRRKDYKLLYVISEH
jgi:hypothetical protein